jgi:hypothetical protein
MEEWLRNYIKTNAFNGLNIKVGNNLPTIKMPCIKDLDDIYTYLFLFTKYIELYNEKKDDMYFDLMADEASKLDFALFLNYFTDIESLDFDNSTFIYGEKTYINYENIGLFMQVIKVLHHRDRKQDYYTYSNSLVDRMLKRAHEAKKKIEEERAKLKAKSKNSDNDSGFLEIQSTLSARHPSLNIIVMKELNYYQILEQYKRLLEIDKYTPVLNGNATEEYVKKLKHYSSKLVDDD